MNELKYFVQHESEMDVDDYETPFEDDVVKWVGYESERFDESMRSEYSGEDEEEEEEDEDELMKRFAGLSKRFEDSGREFSRKESESRGSESSGEKDEEDEEDELLKMFAVHYELFEDSGGESTCHESECRASESCGKKDEEDDEDDLLKMFRGHYERFEDNGRESTRHESEDSSRKCSDSRNLYYAFDGTVPDHEVIPIDDVGDTCNIDMKNFKPSDVVNYDFFSLEVAYLFYVQYATSNGFCVRKDSVVKNK